MVADRPMRWAGRGHRASSRASESIRCAPRFSEISACSSSITTVRTVDSIALPRAVVSRMYSDSGVVMKMWGGLRSIRWRSAPGVSPVRTPTRSSGPPMPSSGRVRFSRMSEARDFSGEMYSTRTPSSSAPRAASAFMRSMSSRKAASVLPVPVGALTSTCSPAAMAGQAARWTAVGSPNVLENQRTVSAENSLRMSTSRRPRAPSFFSANALEPMALPRRPMGKPAGKWSRRRNDPSSPALPASCQLPTSDRTPDPTPHSRPMKEESPCASSP